VIWDILIFILHLVFSISFLFIVDEFFFYYFTQWLLSCLIRCVYKFFNLHLGVFIYIYIYMQNLVEETIYPMLAQENLKVLGAFRLLFSKEKNYLFKQIFEVYTILILYLLILLVFYCNLSFFLSIILQ